MTDINQKPISKIKKYFLMTLVVFLVAFVGGVSGWRVAEQGNQSSAESNTVFVDGNSGSVADIVEAVRGSVVSIDAGTLETSDSYFFGPQEFEVLGSGSGIVFSEDGLIVTNKHVVNESTTTISVFSSDGTEYTDVEYIGSDPFSDIAFLRVNNATDLVVAKIGNSSDMRVGDEVIAIGNALGIYSNTVTRGIISGLGRPIAGSEIEGTEALFNLFQTDASINQGNSGGPLLNARGEVIGINTAVAGQAENIGFAIPINDIMSGVNSILETGELQRPYMGVSFINLDPDLAEVLEFDIDHGALITSQTGRRAVLADSPAEKVGLQEDDVITEVNDQEINDLNPLTSSINGLAVGDKVDLTIYRDGSYLSLVLILEAAPEDL